MSQSRHRACGYLVAVAGATRLPPPRSDDSAAVGPGPGVKETQLLLTNRATHLYKCIWLADLKTYAPPHMCYHAEFGRTALKGVNTKEARKLRSAGTPLSWDGRQG